MIGGAAADDAPADHGNVVAFHLRLRALFRRILCQRALRVKGAGA